MTSVPLHAMVLALASLIAIAGQLASVNHRGVHL
jgi:hypothetical protein